MNIFELLNDILKNKKLSLGQLNLLSATIEAVKLNPDIPQGSAIIKLIWSTADQHVRNGDFTWVMVQRNILTSGQIIEDKKDWIFLFEGSKIKKENAANLLSQLWREPPNLYLAWLLTEPDFQRIEKMLETNADLKKSWDILLNVSVFNDPKALSTRWNLIDMLKSMMSPHTHESVSIPTEGFYENY